MSEENYSCVSGSNYVVEDGHYGLGEIFDEKELQGFVDQILGKEKFYKGLSPAEARNIVETMAEMIRVVEERKLRLKIR